MEEATVKVRRAGSDGDPIQDATLKLIAKMTTSIETLTTRMEQLLEPDVARCAICDHPVSEHKTSVCSHVRCRCDQK